MEDENRAGPEGEEGPMELSMEGLLKSSAETLERLDNKEVAYVRVIQVGQDNVLVDIGEKREAVVPLSDFPGQKFPVAGSRIPVVLEKRGREDAPTSLSHKKARELLGWERIVAAFRAKERVRGDILQVIKGGYLVDLDGVAAFLPLSHSELHGAAKPALAVGSHIRCEILEIHEEKRRVVVSRKLILEEEEKKRRERLLAKLRVGDVGPGWVSRVLPTGLIVNMGGVEGLLPVSDLAWREPEKSLQNYKRGMRLKVKVLRIDAESGRVSFGLKQLTPSPAEALKKLFPLKSTVSGEVTAVAPEGSRLALKAEAVGFLPSAEYASTGAPKPGEVLKAVVTGIHSLTFDVTLSAKRLEDIEDRKRVQGYMKAAPPLTLGQLLAPDE